ncbi:hypothetical protein BH10PSE7_BH10PSE7_19640 [soil metagenome]
MMFGFRYWRPRRVPLLVGERVRNARRWAGATAPGLREPQRAVSHHAGA